MAGVGAVVGPEEAEELAVGGLVGPEAEELAVDVGVEVG